MAAKRGTKNTVSGDEWISQTGLEKCDKLRRKVQTVYLIRKLVVTCNDSTGTVLGNGEKLVIVCDFRLPTPVVLRY